MASQSILDSKGITDAIDSECPPVPAQDADKTVEQVTDLKETCLSSQGVAAVDPDLNKTAVIALKTAERDIVSSPPTISENLEDARVATNVAYSDLQHEPTLPSKSSVEPSSTTETAAKIAKCLSSHLIVDSNGISNANVGIDSECPPFPAQDAEGDTMEQATDLKETCLSPNLTLDTHDIANASTDEACNDPCNEVIDYNAQQDTTSEALVIPKGTIEWILLWVQL